MMLLNVIWIWKFPAACLHNLLKQKWSKTNVSFISLIVLCVLPIQFKWVQFGKTVRKWHQFFFLSQIQSMSIQGKTKLKTIDLFLQISPNWQWHETLLLDFCPFLFQYIILKLFSFAVMTPRAFLSLCDAKLFPALIRYYEIHQSYQ